MLNYCFKSYYAAVVQLPNNFAITDHVTIISKVYHTAAQFTKNHVPKTTPMYGH